MGEVAALSLSTKVRAALPGVRPSPSKNAIPQPSEWWSVQPPRCEKPVKLSVKLAGKWLFIPSSWHMVGQCSPGTRCRANSVCAHCCVRVTRWADQAIGCGAWAAHRAQMHAWLRSCGATRSKSVGAKVAAVHQQGPWSMPVSRWRSIAHWLAWPHRGQWSGAGAVVSVDG